MEAVKDRFGLLPPAVAALVTRGAIGEVLAIGAANGFRAERTAPGAARLFSRALALREGRSEAPQMPWSHSLLTSRILEAWRAAVAEPCSGTS